MSCFSVLLMGPVPAAGGSRLADAIAALTRTLSVVDLRHVGLALATSLSATVNLILLAALLRRHLGRLGVAELLPSFAAQPVGVAGDAAGACTTSPVAPTGRRAARC